MSIQLFPIGTSRSAQFSLIFPPSLSGYLTAEEFNNSIQKINTILENKQLQYSRWIIYLSYIILFVGIFFLWDYDNDDYDFPIQLIFICVFVVLFLGGVSMRRSALNNLVNESSQWIFYENSYYSSPQRQRPCYWRLNWRWPVNYSGWSDYRRMRIRSPLDASLLIEFDAPYAPGQVSQAGGANQVAIAIPIAYGVANNQQIYSAQPAFNPSAAVPVAAPVTDRQPLLRSNEGMQSYQSDHETS